MVVVEIERRETYWLYNDSCRPTYLLDLCRMCVRAVKRMCQNNRVKGNICKYVPVFVHKYVCIYIRNISNYYNEINPSDNNFWRAMLICCWST